MNLQDREETRRAADEIARRIKARFPGTTIEAHDSDTAPLVFMRVFAPDGRK